MCLSYTFEEKCGHIGSGTIYTYCSSPPPFSSPAEAIKFLREENFNCLFVRSWLSRRTAPWCMYEKVPSLTWYFVMAYGQLNQILLEITSVAFACCSSGITNTYV